jgi:hypothetical protein
MAQTKYRIVNEHGEQTTVSLIKFESRENLQKFADALNRRFPNRKYKVEAVRQSAREEIFELMR